MAGNKDFSGISAARLFGAAEQATVEKGHNPEASPAEAHARREAMQTQGRRGAKAIRLNISITPSNHEFVRILARASGQTQNRLINNIIKAYREEHPELMGQANQFLNTLNSGKFSALLFKEEKEEEEEE